MAADVYAFRQANCSCSGWCASRGAVPPISWLYARTLHHLDRLVYRLTRGRATFVSLVTGLPIVMLTTTGAKTRPPATRCRWSALPDGERMVIIASNFGQQRNPAWYYNLRAHPRATIELRRGHARGRRRASCEGEERERRVRARDRDLPGLDRSTAGAPRTGSIPVIELTPVAVRQRHAPPSGTAPLTGPAAASARARSSTACALGRAPATR